VLVASRQLEQDRSATAAAAIGIAHRLYNDLTHMSKHSQTRGGDVDTLATQASELAGLLAARVDARMSRLWREPSWFACAAFFDIDNCELREFTNEQMAEIVTLILSCHVQVVGSADDASETDAQYHRKDLMRIRVWLLELCRTPDIDLPPQLAAISKGERWRSVASAPSRSSASTSDSHQCSREVRQDDPRIHVDAVVVGRVGATVLCSEIRHRRT
jgi:hypothetical protein